MQHVRIVVSRAIGRTAVPVLPVVISDGRLQLGPAVPDEFGPLPLQAPGVVRRWLQLTTADVIDLTGSAVRIEATAEARYVEELPADWRP